jgi:hypothetical protein
MKVDGGLLYNPSSNTITATTFNGNASTATNADNAGTLDGIDSSAFLRSNADDSASGELTFNGRVNIREHIDLSDNKQLMIGSGDDVRIFFDGTNLVNNSVSGDVYWQSNGTSKFFFDMSEGNILPAGDNLGAIGTAARTWNAGAFTNLTVDSTLNVRGAVDLADNDVLRFGSDDDVEMFFDGSNFYTDLNVGDWYIRDGTTTRFTFDDTGDFTATGDITASGDINSSSDVRLKDNIKTLEGSLDKLKQLRGVEYDRIDSSERYHQLGVIAQEIEKVYPSMVKEGENGMKTVSYQHLIPVLIESVKELSTRVEEMESR